MTSPNDFYAKNMLASFKDERSAAIFIRRSEVIRPIFDSIQPIVKSELA
jgi:hypothetical protein